MGNDSGGNPVQPDDAAGRSSTLSISNIFSLGRELAPRETAFVVSGLVLLAGAALTATWGGLPMLVATALALLVGALMVNLLVRALKGRRLNRLGEFVAWVLVVLTLLLLALLLAAAFLPWPGPAGHLLAKLFGDKPPIEQLGPVGGLEVAGQPVTLNSDTALSNLSSEMQLPPVPASTAKPGSKGHPPADLIIDHTTLTIDGDSGPSVLNVGRLDLRHGGIVTNGRAVTIYADSISSIGGYIKAFPQNAAAAPGANGRSAGKVILDIRQTLRGNLAVKLRGESGGNGVKGSPGADGGRGAQGDDSASHALDCAHGPGGGKPGGKGGTGGPGTDGGDAGTGGTLVIASDHSSEILASITLENPPGNRGVGGAGGDGGRGGPGGRGGDSHGPYCRGTGSQGADGDPGDPGTKGSDGQTANGDVAIVVRGPLVSR